MSNGMTPYGYRHSQLSLDQRPIKDEVETDSEGEYVSDFTDLTAEEAKIMNASSQRKPKKPPWMTNPDLNKDPVKSHPLNQADIDFDDECDVAKFSASEVKLHQDAQGSTAHHKSGGSHVNGKPVDDPGPTYRSPSGEAFHDTDEDLDDEDGEPGFDSDPDSEDPGGGYDEDEAPTPTAGNQPRYQEARDRARPTAMEEDPESDDLEDLNEDEDPEFYQGAAQQGFTNKSHGSSAASMALSKAQEVVRRFSSGPAAIALAQPSDDVSSGKAKKILEDGSVKGHPLTEKQKGMFGAAAGRADKAAPNVFRDDSPYGGGGGAGRAPGGQSAGFSGGTRQTSTPASRPQVGQSMGGARAGQPSGGMQPKRTIAYAEED